MRPGIGYHAGSLPRITMATVELTEDSFNSTIENSPFVIIDFWAPWCGPCRNFAPVFEAASEKHPDIVFAKVNTEEEQGIAAAFGIRSIPTLMVFRDQIVLYGQPGALPAGQFDQLIEQAKALDMDKVRAEVAAQQQDGATG
jgi:thioredoxin